MTEIKLYKSSWKGARLIALSLPFVIIGTWMILEEQIGTFDYIMGWLCVSFFGLGISLGFFVLFDKRPQIIINENGISDRTLKQGEIKWEQIIETYLIDIHNQKFISIVVCETFEFKKKQYKWAEKLNEFVGTQKLNLNLSQIKIDEIELTELLNKIINSEKKERQNHIRVFSSNQKIIPNFELQNYLIYFIILIVLVFASLSNFKAFMTIIILTGIAAIIARWYQGKNNKSILYKYARIMTFLGFINIVVLLLVFKSYDFISDKIGIEIHNEIEIYKSKFGNYPNDIKNICEKLNLNPIQNYIVDKIEYEKNGDEYKLKLETLNHNQKEFDAELNEWN
ncbi:STM3941 family protein [Flavobacterium chungangense]|uniref:STM3941 family protein n=2 Tax=Flavobacterium chungangense TaxID=554283 RepID=UPI0004DF29DA|nr:STM3941 family protein [Flavobacterium chungangense]